MKRMEEYRLVIWDLDGTLYYQKPFRRKMAEVLVKQLLFQPSYWKELLVIRDYRKLREAWDPFDTRADLEGRQYEVCAKRWGLSRKRAEEIIVYWMQKKPLEYLYRYRDELAAEMIEKMRKRKICNVVYSDYPTQDKLETLKIQVDGQFYSGEDGINCMKPNPGGILAILEKMGRKPEEVLMIGDRMEKDGAAAKGAGVDYLILESDPNKRRRQYEKMQAVF